MQKNNSNNNDSNNNDSNKNNSNNNNSSNKNSTDNNDVKKEIISWIKVIALAIIITWGVNNYVVVNATIPTESMEDTLMVGDRVFSFRLSYLFDVPKRGEIIVFLLPDDESKRYIKRIIGLPGETVEGIDGIVYIDGEPLDESYIDIPLEEDFGPFNVPEDSYFMMGDNRNISYDSRYWEEPFVKDDKILGKAILKYYPKIEFLK